MTIKKPVKIFIASVLGLVLIGALAILYVFNQPHRDVQNTKTDFSFNASQIVSEYLKDPNSANQKYLDEEGDSKILEVTGAISDISEDFNGKKVLLLKNATDKAGVSCTLKDSVLNGLILGSMVRVKGVIRSGASYDTDMDLYENVIMEDCKIIN